MYKLPKIELERIENILKRALDVEKGVTEKVSVTEEHPDGSKYFVQYQPLTLLEHLVQTYRFSLQYIKSFFLS